MKKWIPKNTSYCYGCPWYRHIKTIYYHANPVNPKNSKYLTKCPYIDGCKNSDDCRESSTYRCKVNVIKCEYLGLTDNDENTLLWNGVKECGVHEKKGI